jgi:hypothetical protein
MLEGIASSSSDINKKTNKKRSNNNLNEKNPSNEVVLSLISLQKKQKTTKEKNKLALQAQLKVQKNAKKSAYTKFINSLGMYICVRLCR